MTPKQILFVEEYLKDLNATQAAIRAGYSEKTAGQIGEENLKKPEIRKAIDEAMLERSKKTSITQERVLEALGQIAFGDPRTLYDGNDNLLPVSQLSDEAVSLIAGFDVSVIRGKNKDDDDEFVKKVKFNDKLRALELLGRHLGMFKDKIEVSGNVGLADRMSKARERLKKHRGRD